MDSNASNLFTYFTDFHSCLVYVLTEEHGASVLRIQYLLLSRLNIHDGAAEIMLVEIIPCTTSTAHVQPIILIAKYKIPNVTHNMSKHTN